MTRYFKTTHLDGRGFEAGDHLWMEGAVTSLLGNKKGVEVLGSELLYAATEPGNALIGGSWPCKLFEVEPIGTVTTDKRQPDVVGAHSWSVERQLPAAQVFGPNGDAVVAMLETISVLAPGQFHSCGFDWDDNEFAALDNAGKLASTNGRLGAWNGAWVAAEQAISRRVWEIMPGVTWGALHDNARRTVRDAVLAIVVRDLIDIVDFRSLYGPWERTMDVSA